MTKPYVKKRATKSDLLERVYKRTSMTQAYVDLAVNEFLRELVKEIESGREVRINELGTFKIATRKPYAITNTSSGSTVDVPAMRMPRLRFNKGVVRNINKARGE